MKVPALRLAAAFVMLVGCGPKRGGGDDSETDGLVSIDVMPANATLTYTGTPASLAYTALGHYDDGHTAPLPDAMFSLDAPGALLGTFDAATFTASGTAAGKAGVRAALGDITGDTALEVAMQLTELGSGVPDGAGSDFPIRCRPAPRRRCSTIRSMARSCRRASRRPT